ncbi:transglutaminase family protein [Pelistega sp. MC2]|uniref:transglutaminase family protein n=1 Tax=Pelistega sp. MC2 TaxID=1720297 RepID=UPI0008D9F37C|nr:transglutaminase family protein [Pelistega sp. MC2]
MKLQIDHSTQYFYANSAKRSIQILRVTPQTLAHQRVLSWQLTLPRISEEFFDGFGNFCTVLNVTEPHNVLNIHAQGIVEIDNKSEYSNDDRVPADIFLNTTGLTHCSADMYEFTQKYTVGVGNRSSLSRLSQAILEYIPYTPGATNVATTAVQSFEAKQGVCQDHTHVFLACARSIGVPTRYVSGYLYVEEENHLASHSWAEAYLNNHWFVFDVSNQLFQPRQHVQLAVGLDYNDAAPLRGMRQGGGQEQMEFLVRVSPVKEQ